VRAARLTVDTHTTTHHNRHCRVIINPAAITAAISAGRGNEMIGSKAPPDTPPATSPANSSPAETATWTYEEVARMFNVTKQTVYEWVRAGSIPSPIYLGSTARFRASDIAAVLDRGLSIAGTFTVAPSPRSERASKARKKANTPKRKKVSTSKVKSKKQPAKKGAQHK